VEVEVVDGDDVGEDEGPEAGGAAATVVASVHARGWEPRVVACEERGFEGVEFVDCFVGLDGFDLMFPFFMIFPP
jgi:hypothetical protein